MIVGCTCTVPFGRVQTVSKKLIIFGVKIIVWCSPVYMHVCHSVWHGSNLKAICQLYDIYGMIVCCTYLSGRVYLAFTLFPRFIGYIKFMKYLYWTIILKDFQHKFSRDKLNKKTQSWSVTSMFSSFIEYSYIFDLIKLISLKFKYRWMVLIMIWRCTCPSDIDFNFTDHSYTFVIPVVEPLNIKMSW